MAFVVKDARGNQYNDKVPVLSQWQHVKKAAATVPQTAAQTIFNVYGGRVLVKGLLGEVTTIIGATVENIKVSATARDAAAATIGTAVDVASNVDCNALEVGGKLWVEGDGTALVKSNAGAAFVGPNSGQWIAPQGIITYTTGASTTGAIKWDIFYQPLDEGAYVVSA